MSESKDLAEGFFPGWWTAVGHLDTLSMFGREMMISSYAAEKLAGKAAVAAIEWVKKGNYILNSPTVK